MARIRFAEDLKKLQAVIKVIGLGGAGGNAVNRMVEAGVHDVELISANTDAQALASSKAPFKVQIGEGITRGLGVGGDPAKGRMAGLDSQEHIREVLAGADLVFITAGMGGGTGTGVAPIAAQIAKELNALTIGVVTKPFQFEGRVRSNHAEMGIKELRSYVDTLLVIPNDRIFQVADETTLSLEAYRKVDDVLRQAVQAISDIITQPGSINVDLNDIKAIMTNAGEALMGVGEAFGPSRAVDAAKNAIASPLLENVSIDGATGLLVNIVGNRNVAIGEIREAMEFISPQVAQDAKIKYGHVFSDSMDDRIRITVIATGFPPHRRLLLGGRGQTGRGARDEGRSPAPEDLLKPAFMRFKLRKLR
ncbi:MAG: cell division protein FtsZ [Elusimicrobia bacterium]|nr:cell division protein FtsZ [Elusimicrobiota bacterium]